MKRSAPLVLAFLALAACSAAQRPISEPQPSASSLRAAQEREKLAEQMKQLREGLIAATHTEATLTAAQGVLDALTAPVPACPDGMVEVEGDYCPALVETCKTWVCPPDGTKGCEPSKRFPTARCGEWQRPTKCLTPPAKRPHLRYCIDKYEWPNVEGQRPKSWMSWFDAKRELEAAGKRMCTDVEWTFAAEGPDGHPYPFGDGYHRDEANKACNFDHPIKGFDVFAARHPGDAMAQRLDDLLVTAGSMPQCHSDFGVYDMAGNIDEFTVNVTGHGKPYVSYLKGGHVFGVRNASRPATEAHGPEFVWYETGTRACKDVQ